MREIMVVDDDSTSLAITKAVLQQEYNVVLMKSGIQALGYLGSKPVPDLMLLDMVMPGTSGIDVLREMKASERLRNIPVVFLSGMENARAEETGIQLGAADFLHKPVIPFLLRRKVQTQITLLDLQQENAELRETIRAQEAQLRAVGQPPQPCCAKGYEQPIR